MEITTAAIGEAANRIAPYVRYTPILELEAGAVDVPGRIVLKLDLLQPTGTFKIRGAVNLLLSHKPELVVAASGGNFALAIAHAAHVLGIRAHLFVPDSSPPEKIRRLQGSSAEVTIVAGVYKDALAMSQAFAATVGGLLAHAYDLPEVVAGAGTCGPEILNQVPGVDSILVAVGGGGLIGGIASAVRTQATIIGVETENTPTLHAARAAGHPVEVEVGGLALSSLGSSRLGEIAWEAARQWVTDSLLVSDEAVREAQRFLWEKCRLVVEPGAATTVAALLCGAYVPAPDETVVALVCGANVDPATVA
ncbi:MAG TPA: threonine/serine dehydratase [Acidimicrobiia bacterium]|nr:threonine/serine dehydratase [Acidimicrobiia bacterium]